MLPRLATLALALGSACALTNYEGVAEPPTVQRWSALAAKLSSSQQTALLDAVRAAQCGPAGTGLDLSSLTRADDDYVYATSDKHYTWYMNVCHNTVNPCLGDHTSAPAIWNYDYQQPYACFNLGNVDTAAWSGPTEQFTAAVKYTGGDMCYNTQPPMQYSFEMQFKCNPTITGAVVESVVTGATMCDYVATFQTSAACKAANAEPATVSAVRP